MRKGEISKEVEVEAVAAVLDGVVVVEVAAVKVTIALNGGSAFLCLEELC